MQARAGRSGVAEMLEALADWSGDQAFRRAASALRQNFPGRPAVDDAAALAEAEALLKSGAEPTLNAAIRLVVKARADRPFRRAMFERLRRKAKKVCT